MSHVKLTFVCPPALGEQVIEALVESERLPAGFTTFPASGHGRDFADASVREKVRGRVDATVILAIMPIASVQPLLQELSARFPTPHLVHWTEAVLSFGDFG